MTAFLKYKYNIALLCILIIGFFFRFHNLASNPPGFFADEASIGYNAYTILNFGTDEYGERFPFFYRAFGEYKNPIQMYSTVPFIALFGLSEFSVRLPSVLYGLLGIVALYLLAKQLFHEYQYKTTIGLLAAFFLAISPWHIHFSRSSLEGLTAYVAFTVLATYFFLKAKNHSQQLFISIIFFVLAFYSYFPARLFIPLFAGTLFLFHYRFFLKHKRVTFYAIVLLLFCTLPMLLSLTTTDGLSRWQQVSIFTNPKKDIPVSLHILNNYISHFSPSFLFLKGDIGMPGQFITRHSVRGMGELYLFQLPFIVLGLYFLLKKKQKDVLFLILMWLLFYPVGSMFTLDRNAQATRSIIGVVPFQILSAFGMAVFLFSLHRYRMVVGVFIALVIVFSVVVYKKELFIKYPTYAADFWGWQYGARDVIKYFETEQNKYDAYVLAPEFNAPHIFFKFYALDRCQTCFVGLPHEFQGDRDTALFAVTSDYLRQHPEIVFQTKHKVYYPNGSVAFQIGEVVE